MLPEWLNKKDVYISDGNGNSFIVKTVKTIGGAMSRIKIQKGHEKGRALPPLLKLFMMFGGILLVSASRNRLVTMAYAAGILLYVSSWPAEDIGGILKPGMIAALFTFVLLIPSIIMKPSIIANEIIIAVKVFLSVLTVNIFNHTTQWNHITGSLRKIHVPGLFVFVIDITLKYIVMLGNQITEMLTSLELRSVGKNNKKYNSVGGVMGVNFIKGVETNRQMYEAMMCRGFTDDYKGL